MQSKKIINIMKIFCRNSSNIKMHNLNTKKYFRIKYDVRHKYIIISEDVIMVIIWSLIYRREANDWPIIIRQTQLFIESKEKKWFLIRRFVIGVNANWLSSK